jgi:hypothetical protein
MTNASSFEIDVECTAEGKPHRHLIRIEPSMAPPAFAGLPRSSRPAGRRFVEYTCPVTGERRKASFSAPPGFDWPFTVLSVD